jgi:hypothetical protein
MNRTLFLAAALCTTGPALAQDAPVFELAGPSTSYQLPALSLTAGDAASTSLQFTHDRKPRGKGLRDAGIAVTAVGLGLATIGGSLLIAGATGGAGCPEFECMSTAIMSVAGGISTVSAAPFLITGASMWGAGQARMNRHRPLVAVAPGFGPRGASLDVAVQF